MISEQVPHTRAFVVRPRDTILSVARTDDSSLTPCFDGHDGLQKQANFAERMGLTPGLQIADEKTKSALEDRRWLEHLTRAKTTLEINEGSYAVLKRVHRILLAHETSRLDCILRHAPVDRLSIQILVALLASSSKAKRFLIERDGFYQRVKARLRRDEPQRTDALLRGLR